MADASIYRRPGALDGFRFAGILGRTDFQVKCAVAPEVVEGGAGRRARRGTPPLPRRPPPPGTGAGRISDAPADVTSPASRRFITLHAAGIHGADRMGATRRRDTRSSASKARLKTVAGTRESGGSSRRLLPTRSFRRRGTRRAGVRRRPRCRQVESHRRFSRPGRQLAGRDAPGARLATRSASR